MFRALWSSAWTTTIEYAARVKSMGDQFDRRQRPGGILKSAQAAARPAGPLPGGGVRRALRGKRFAQQSAMLSARPSGSDGAASPSPAAAATPAASHPMLRTGSRGPAVAELQARLSSRGASLVADGVFGPATQSAVVGFQRSAGLSPDGIVGPLTWSALDGGARAPGASGGPSPQRLAAIQMKLGLVRARMASLAGKGPPAAADVAAPEGPPAAEPASRAGWLDDISDAASDAWDSATDVAGEAWDTATDAAGQAWDTATDVAGQAWDTAKDVAGDVVDTAKDVAGQAWDATKKAAENAWGTGKEVVKDVAKTAEEGYGGTGGVAPTPGVDVLKEAADRVRAEVESWASGVGERFSDGIDRLKRALKLLERPLEADLDEVEAALDGLIDQMDPSAAKNEVGTDDEPPEPEPGAYVFTVTQPPKRVTTRLSAQSLVDLKVASEAASRGQAGGGKKFLYVQPAPFKTSGKKTDAKGRVVALTVQTQETMGIPTWPEHDADPNAWHPKAREAWQTARQGMEVHEDGHLQRDLEAFTAEALQEEVHGKPQADIGPALDKIEDAAKADSDTWDANTDHGVMGTPSTVVRIPHFQEVEAWNKEHPEDKDKKM